MSEFINPWEMGQELNVATIPNFTKAKYMTLRIAPPKGKGVREGLIATLGMLSYESNEVEVETINITDSPEGYRVTFPHGKRGILATKYRGPKSWYRFVNSKTNKWYQVGSTDPRTGINTHLMPDFVEETLAKKIPNWEQLEQSERDIHIDNYYWDDMYMFGLAKDYNLPYELDKTEVPKVGMVTEFYRRYTPPKEGERFGNTIITKFAPAEGKENLSGEYTMADAEIAASVLDAILTKEDSSFNPDQFKSNSDDNEDEFDLAA